MQSMSTVKKTVISAACVALCVVLPIAFHAVPNAGSIFLPMHIPVLLSGLICGWYFGLLTGLLGPLLSTLLTGMPPVAYLPSMLVELAAYGAAAGLMMRFVRTKKLYADLYISLIAALLIGRAVGGAARALIFMPGAYGMAAWVSASFVTAWPGLVIQLALIPAIVLALEKARLIPKRYAENADTPEAKPALKQQDVIAFFDRLAPSWDEGMIRDDQKIARILDYAGVRAGAKVLDVACGTGVLIPDYLARDVAHVTGVDISSAMIARAKEKFTDPRVDFIEADVNALSFPEGFDCCVVYNALPHFSDPATLMQHLAGLLVPGGRLTIAHGRSREAVNQHHSGAASSVSVAMPEAEALAALLPSEIKADTVVSDDSIYVVSGVKVE